MKFIALVIAALSVSACAEYKIIGAGPEGGLVSRIGDSGMSKSTERTMITGWAENVCGKYGKKAVVEDDSHARLVKFTCIDKDK